MPCARSSLSAMCSGPCSMRSIRPTVAWKPVSIKMQATTIPDSARPRLTKGVRLQTYSVIGKSVLLYPEGIVELNETAREILSRCDWRTFGEIVCQLPVAYDADSN